MGRDLWDLKYYERRRETDALAQKVGVNRDDYVETDIDGERGMTNNSYKKFEEAIINAKSNNYDTRRSIEAAKLAGYAGADKLGNISNLKEVSDAYDFLEGVHKSMGATGKFNSANDRANVTKYLVDQDRTNFKGTMPEPEKEDKDKEEEVPDFFDKDPEREKFVKDVLEKRAAEFRYGDPANFKSYSDGEEYDARKNDETSDMYDPDKDDEAETFLNRKMKEVVQNITPGLGML